MANEVCDEMWSYIQQSNDLTVQLHWRSRCRRWPLAMSSGRKMDHPSNHIKHCPRCEMTSWSPPMSHLMRKKRNGEDNHLNSLIVLTSHHSAHKRWTRNRVKNTLMLQQWLKPWTPENKQDKICYDIVYERESLCFINCVSKRMLC